MDFPFVGPSYQSSSINVDAERSINLYPEIVESQQGKNKWYLRGTPGLTPFCLLPKYPIRGVWVVVSNIFVVAGNTLYLVAINGSYSAIGTLITSTGYVGMSDNGLQLCIVDGPNEYIYNFASSIFSLNPCGGNFLGANVVDYIDNYFVFAKPASRDFFLSQLNDGATINPLDIATKEGASDLIVAIITLHRQLYIFGSKTAEIWWDTGANTFPFSPIQGVFIECGCAAPMTVKKADNTVMWLSKDERGQGIVYKMSGYAPVRVSTHAIEKIIRSWGNLSNAAAYVYQIDGHEFYVLNNPDALTTLVYNGSTSSWHERQWFNPLTGAYSRHRGQFYGSATGDNGQLSIVSDYETGQLYTFDDNNYTDNGNPIHRIRIAPPSPNNDLNRVFYNRFQVDIEAGVGLDGGVQGSDPKIIMQQSNDGGHTWSGERVASMGKIGETKMRAYWNKCGMARNRVFKVKVTDPVKVVMIDAKIDARPGNS